MPELEDTLIEDDGVRLFRSGLEAVQFGGHDWRKLARSAKEWGYAGVQFSSFHLSPKELVETDLAEQVKGYLAGLGEAYDSMPFDLAGFSTHCAMLAWGFPQKPGTLNLVPAGEDVKKRLFGKPNEQRKWMWDNVVQYIPAATAKLGLNYTHSFLPPAVIGDIPGMKFAGADTASYPFVFNAGVQVVRKGNIEKVDLWQEAVHRQGERLKPFFKDCRKYEIGLAHEPHWDTLARSPREFEQVREMIGEGGKDSVVWLGYDGSHAWKQGDGSIGWIRQGGKFFRIFHVKNIYIAKYLPTVTGNSAWPERGEHFTSAVEGEVLPAELLTNVAFRTELPYHPQKKDQKPVGTIGGRPVYLNWAVSEGESPIMTQVTTAREYAREMQPLCLRKYGEGFKVAGSRG